MHGKLRYKKCVRFVSAVIIILGLLITLFNYLLKYSILDSARVGNMPIAPDAGICFILASASLYMSVSYKKQKQQIAKPLAVMVFIIALLAFTKGLGYLPAIIKLGMSALTAFCFIIINVPLFFIRNTAIAKISQWLLHMVTLISFLALIGHMLNVPDLYKLSALSAMALYTAITFIFFSSIATLVHPAFGITAIFTGRLIGNLMARRLFFAMLLGILAIAYARFLAHKNSFVSWEMGLAIMTVSFCTITLVLIWIVSSILNKAYIKLKTAQENLKHVVDAAPYAIFMADYNANIIQANRKTEQIYGFEEDELIGTPLKDLIPKSLHGNYAKQRDDFFEENEVVSHREEMDLMAVRKNGSEFPVEMHFIPLETDRGKFFLTYVIDISATKQNQQIITSQLIELQSKNQELAQFNYISSHDLQEPLRTVLNYLEMIEEDHPDIDSEVLTHLQSVKNTVVRMSRIVKSLLDFGRLGQNKKMILTDVTNVINNVTDDLQNMIRESEANITVLGAMPKMYAYETELRQLFQNLISNAIKFSKRDDTPSIEIRCKKLKGSYKFYVSDNGIGIDPKHFDRIFNIFQRLNRDDDYDGYGIGLANCKKIAEMHGGKIWVESEPGNGTTFIFTLLNFTS